MTGSTVTALTTQVYRVYIRATPEAIWEAITDPAWSDRYGYGGRVEFDLRPGGAYRTLSNDGMRAMGVGEVVADGEVVEADPPRRLVQTWRLVMAPEMAEEGFTRLTYELADTRDGVTRLTVTHELDGAPKTAHLVSGGEEDSGAGGGWAWILSGLKTLLETGSPLTAAQPVSD
jgi:uncharacterized protein YndB with AHSA1/START domain